MSVTGLAYLLFFFLGLAAAVSSNVIWGFYVYEVVYFLNPDNRWWSSSIPGLSYSFIAVAVMLFIYLIRKDTYKENKLRDNPQTKWFILTLIIYSLATLVAIDTAAHKKALYELYKLFLIMAVAYKIIDSPEKLIKCLWFYMIGAAYIGIEALDTPRNAMGRVEVIGPIDSPDANLVSAAIAPTIPLALYFFWRGSRNAKIASVILGALIANGIVLMNSRGAFLGIAAGMLFFVLSSFTLRANKGRYRAQLILIVLLGIGATISITDQVFWERMSTLNEVEDESKSGSHRYHMWLSAIDMVEGKPLGAGAGGFEVLSPQFVPIELFHEGQERKAVHSMWFQCLSEVGWFGLFLFMCLLGSTYFLSRKTKKELLRRDKIDEYILITALQAALVTFLVAGTFINRYRAETLYWLLLFIACAANIYLIKYRSK